MAPIPAPWAWDTFQRAVSLIALVALTPVFAVLWALVKVTSRGPFLVKQRREGFLGVPIDLLKVRTVRQPEPYAELRQTPVGSLLRKLKLDELPQLWNVVRGDLAWIGPRPLSAAVGDKLREEYPHYDERLRVQPGLASIGVISSIYDESRAYSEPSYDDLLSSDLHYLTHRSVSYDLVVIALTSLYMVRRAMASVFRSRVGKPKDDIRTRDEVYHELTEWLAASENQLSTRESSIAWRFGQRCIAALGLVILSPMAALLYIGVRATSPGPFIFSQTRRGFLGKPFRIYKIRTLSVGSESKTALGVQSSDTSVTRIGKILRSLKIDEFPQLWNVIRGDMELVGPRPIPMALEEHLVEQIPDFRMRQLVKPGLTNVGQISVIDNAVDEGLIADWTVRAESERHYVQNKSLAYDLVMVVMTALYLARKVLHRSNPIPQRGNVESASLVLGTAIGNVDYEGVISRIQSWVEAGDPHRYVCICPVHSVVEATLRQQHRQSLEEADLNTADGMPIVWAQRMLGHRSASRVYGPTLMLKALERAEQMGWRVALFGGHPDRMDTLELHLRERFPELRLVYRESPPFRPATPEEDEALVGRLNESRADLIWVGLGCPKQERWMQEHRKKVRGVLIGVGAAFDFHAGAVRQAPAWMQAAGLEWFFRLLCEPRRLFRRYATTNPIFLLRFGVQLAFRVIFRRNYQIGSSRAD